MLRKPAFLLFTLAALVFISGCSLFRKPQPKRRVRKPVIYLYTEKDQRVNVNLEIEGSLQVTEPLYKSGWQVIAHPDGSVTDAADGKNYPYLYWEADMDFDCGFDEGFLIPGDSVDFYLRKILPQTGLNENEQKDFRAYWTGPLSENKFNLVTFPNAVYERKAKLHVYPEPEKTLRVFMAFKSLEQRIAVHPQHFPAFERSGFTLVEWGGVDLDEAAAF